MRPPPGRELQAPLRPSPSAGALARPASVFAECWGDSRMRTLVGQPLWHQKEPLV